MNIIPTEQEIEEILRKDERLLATIHYEFPEGYEFIRARYHNSNAWPLCVANINYPPDPTKIDMGRANDWNQQVFYGMLPTGGLGPKIAACQEIADDVNPVPTFTVSHWRVKKPLVPVLSLVMNKVQSMGNEFARLTYQRNMDYLGDMPTAHQGGIKASLDSIGRQFAKEITDCNYRDTVKHANYYFSKGYKAILYSSVSYDHRAVCIAMPKDVADEYLEPVRGGMIQIHVYRGWADVCCYHAFHVEGDALMWEYNHERGVRPPFAHSVRPARVDVCKTLRKLHQQRQAE